MTGIGRAGTEVALWSLIGRNVTVKAVAPQLATRPS